MAELSNADWERYVAALCLWREARGETIEAQEWVVWTMRNRCKPGWWNPSGTLAGAVLHPYQYSSMTAPGDKQLIVFPMSKQPDGPGWVPDQAWMQCMWVVDQVLMTPEYADPSRGADSYYDDSIGPPDWAMPERSRGKKGRLNFYKVLT